MQFSTADLGRLIDEWVHDDARRDGLAAARHRLFIAGALVSGLVPLAGFPVFAALHGPPDWAATIAFALLTAPLLAAIVVSRTGRLERGYLIVMPANVAFVLWLALVGGAPPVLLAGLAIVPLDAALSGVRNVTLSATALSLLAGALLLFFGDPANASAAAAPVYFVLVLQAGVLALKTNALGRHRDRANRHLAEGFRLLSEHASDLITCHGADGGVRFASAAATSLCGVGPDRLLGTGLLRHISVADRPALLGALADALDGRPRDFRLRLDRRDGEGRRTSVPVEMRASRSSDPETGDPAVVVVTREISKELARERELAEAREAADRASRAKSAFLAGMSHELRTPLNAIIGFSEILKEASFDRITAESRRDYARLIHASGEHLLSVVNELLDLSRMEAGALPLRREPVDLAALVGGCLDEMQAVASAASVSFIRNLPPALPEVELDPQACRQMVLNLLANAVKLSAAGAKIVVGLRWEGTEAVLSVRGCGVETGAPDLPRPVPATSGRERGSDGAERGLSMATRLAELHGGGLTVHSAAGEGTTVIVTLPAGVARERLSAARRPEASPGPAVDSIRERKRA